VTASVDVTPRVWDRLREVRLGRNCSCCGEWSASEQRALDLYGPLARRDVGAMTIGQVGQSLDGRIATPTDDARIISSSDGLTHLHRMRALVDGVIIGVNTALHDQPQLTVRRCAGTNPARIVIDPKGRLSDDAPLFTQDGAQRIVIQAVERARPAGVEVVRLDPVNGFLDPAAILTALRRRGLTTLMVEGGSFTLGRFVEAGLLDRLHIGIAPVIIGVGPQGLTLPAPPKRLGEAIYPATQLFSLESDAVFDAALTPLGELARVHQHR